MDRVIPIYPPQALFARGIITVNQECLFNYMTSQYQISLRVESMTQWKQVSSLKVFLAETKGKIYLINIITTVAFWI
jgi:hypothetical protein